MNRLDLLKKQLTTNKTNNDIWSHVTAVPLDAILGMSVLYKADNNPNKVDLGVGAYRTEESKPYVFKVIKEAENQIHSELTSGKANKEYQGSEGNAQFLDLCKKVSFGEDYGKIKNRVASIQSIGGTGALRISADFLKVFNPATIYLPKPTWGNHGNIFKRSGLQIGDYPYWKKETRGLDIDGLLKRFEEIPNKSTILLHTCAHNPTGVDPSKDQWKKIAEVMKRKNHLPLFDTAYQGFATGDIDNDGFAIRYFVEQGFNMIVTQSFSKTMGLYGERAGCCHFVANNEKTCQILITQLRVVVRVNYSNPPLHPMRLVLKVLSDEKLCHDWKIELKSVADRIIEMRKLLRAELERIGTPGDWSNITNQIGMFSYTGLSETQSERMTKKYHIYMLKNGRISMSGLTTTNVPLVASCMKKSIEEGQ